MAQRRRRKHDAVDELFDFLAGLDNAFGGGDIGRDVRSAFHQAAAGAADALGFPPPHFAEDRGRVGPSPSPESTPRHPSRYESVGPEHYLVARIVTIGGRPKLEWRVYKADDPDAKPEKFVDEYLADRSVLGILIFQGALIFRDMRQFPGTAEEQHG